MRKRCMGCAPVCKCGESVGIGENRVPGMAFRTGRAQCNRGIALERGFARSSRKTKRPCRKFEKSGVTFPQRAGLGAGRDLCKCDLSYARRATLSPASAQCVNIRAHMNRLC